MKNFMNNAIYRYVKSFTANKALQGGRRENRRFWAVLFKKQYYLYRNSTLKFLRLLSAGSLGA
jgi:hypothetical protein